MSYLIREIECDVCNLTKKCVRRRLFKHWDNYSRYYIYICKECLQTMLKDLEIFESDSIKNHRDKQ